MLAIVVAPELFFLFSDGEQYVAYAPRTGERYSDKSFIRVASMCFPEDSVQPELVLRELLFAYGNNVVVAVREGKNQYRFFAGPDISHLREVA